jgi:hypothetical protein
MSRSIFIGMLALLIWSCSPVKNAAKTSAALTKNNQDSTEYGIVIIDPGFDQWYLANYSQALDRTNDYYRSKNNVAVSNWNFYYRTGRYGKIVNSDIDYRPNIDYGIDVNRRLYWYFEYIESEFRVNLF